jgi:hypothetical protein
MFPVSTYFREGLYQVSYRQVFWLPGHPSVASFPFGPRVQTVDSTYDGRHRLQRRVRGRFSRPSLFTFLSKGVLS